MIGHDWNANLLSDHPSKVEIRPERVVEELKEILKDSKKKHTLTNPLA
jgi:hypothetical protein